jgi:phenylacetate-coenzyme A ligase PaaK-like adenylate-forming protein
MTGHTIEQQRAEHFAYLCKIMPEMVGRLSWSRAQIEAYQTKALRELLQHAKAHSSWYRARLSHLDAATATLADLAKIPSMNKNDLMEHWDAIVTVPGASLREAEAKLRSMTDQFYIWEDHVLFASGGTGGRPGIFVYDWDGLAQNWAGMCRSIPQYVASLPLPGAPAPQPVRLVAVGAEISAHGSFVVGKVFTDPHNPVIRLSGWRSAEELVPKLNAAQPEFLVCYPSLIPALAAAAKAGELKMSPRVLVCGGEHFSMKSQQLAREAWPTAEVLFCWGTSEGGGTFPCPLGDGFHICEDQVIMEPVDATDAPIAAGQHSAGLYFTNLYNKAQPIFRYYIDDVFEMAEGPCACGSVYRKVRQVHGREFEKFKYGSITVHPVALQLAVLEQPRVLEYQIRQTERGAHLSYQSKGEVDTQRLRSRMYEALRSYGLAEPVVTVEQVAILERTAAGKLKRFVPLVR